MTIYTYSKSGRSGGLNDNILTFRRKSHMSSVGAGWKETRKSQIRVKRSEITSMYREISI